ncbi:ERF3A factor, partial [Certhia familiaris]|nr:ERF3A factor [Certhia familiaris]
LVENGETEMSPEESWDHKEEPSETELGGGDAGPSEESAQEMMEEEEEIPKPKSVVAPPGAPKKEHVNVVFIGHVDAGKSTIGGQIMYLTGMVDKRTLEKYEREAKEKNRETWYLSWALDTNQEERDKGKTVEVGRAYFETEKKHFTILDAPGHKSFVPNMIGGASQADLAVLVISARKGEFETGFEKGGQTREHAMLAKTAGVKHLIVLINKMDDPTVNWSNERYEECKEKLVPFLKKVGFNPKKDIHFMPCSGLTGANLKEQSEFCPWYIGLPFIPYLDNLPNFNRSVDGPIRLPIVDKYKDMGTVVLGKLESGSICKGQQLVMMPNKHNVEVLGILSDDVETDSVAPGENLKIRLKGIEEEEILPGFILCDLNNLCHSGRTFDAQIVIIEHKSIICPGYNAVLHIHTCIEEVEITALICLVDKKTGEKSKTRPRFVKQDQVCIARLRTAGTICLETFKDFPQMGRFTLRDEGKTIAIGKVLKLVPEKD